MTLGLSSLTGAQFCLIVAVYCGLHAFLRGTVSETAGIDDVDQILRAQLWSWGYGPQPPLYTWLTKIFLGVFGYNVFSLALLKECLIFAIFGLVYANTWRLTGSRNCALGAAALLEFLPSISWEAHRELTHTVLASAFVLAGILCFLRLEPSRWSTYLLFGLCGGLGILSKYNFAIVFLGLLLAASTVRAMHPVIFNHKMLVGMLVALAVCGPHLNWVVHNDGLAFSSVQKLKIDETGRWLVPVAAGLSKFALVVLSHVGLLFAFVALMFWQGRRSFSALSAREQVLWRMLLWIIALVGIAIAAFKVTNPRDRYVQPLFVWLPIALAVLVREHLTARRLANIVALSAAIAGAILVVAPGRVLLTEPLNKHEVLTIPFKKLAKDLVPAAEKADCIVAEDHPLAGNLRLWFPNKVVLDPEVGPLFAPPSGTTLLVWDAGRSPVLPLDLQRFAHAFTGRVPAGEVTTCEELLKYHHQRTMRIGSAVVP